jgi:hypothetical protein
MRCGCGHLGHGILGTICDRCRIEKLEADLKAATAFVFEGPLGRFEAKQERYGEPEWCVIRIQDNREVLVGIRSRDRAIAEAKRRAGITKS